MTTMDTTTLEPLDAALTHGVSEKQFNFLTRLVRERTDDYWPADANARQEKLHQLFRFGELTRSNVSREIEYWLGRPKVATDRPTEVHAELTIGVYELDGRIYVVKKNQAKTRLYAKRLVELNTARRVNEADGVVAFDYEYAPGAIYDLRPEHRMTKERATELALRYGRCMNCNRPLKAAKSVLAGYGPVCIKAFA
jgi:hypothetical protein